MYVIGILLALVLVLMTCLLSGNATRIFLLVLTSLVISAALISPRYRPYVEIIWYIIGFGCFIYLLVHRYIPGIRQIGSGR
jgi:hypothetical protein